MIKIEGYHGTDLECAQKIVNTEFSFNYSETHWLGNGSYFFIDESLAKWWTHNPSKRFGVKVNTGAILKCTILLKEGHYLDLRNLQHFEFMVKVYYEEFLPKLKEGVFKLTKVNIPRIRCAFCDFLNTRYDIGVIIANFSEPEQSYLPIEYATSNSLVSLFYIETQMCVFDNKYISRKEICYIVKED